MWAASAGWRPAPQQLGAASDVLLCGPGAAATQTHQAVPMGPEGREASPKFRGRVSRGHEDVLPGPWFPHSASAIAPEVKPADASGHGLGVRSPWCGSDFLCQGDPGAAKSRGGCHPQGDERDLAGALQGWAPGCGPAGRGGPQMALGREGLGCGLLVLFPSLRGPEPWGSRAHSLETSDPRSVVWDRYRLVAR